MNTSICPTASETHIEMPELKTPIYSERDCEDLSEWELARITSKTWSMEQD